MNKNEIIAWLLNSDPAIRWQVMKDLQNAEETIYSKERKKLVKEGWCAKLLGKQDKNGLWSGSLYNGKWVSTTYTLYLLKLFGLFPFNDQALAACARLFEQGIFDRREIRFSREQAFRDLGVTGLILSMCCYFGYDHGSIHRIVEYLIARQCEEGNWLPNDDEASAAYTFETTLIILEGLLQYRNRYQKSNNELINTEIMGQNFLLRHSLFLDNGQAIKNKWISFSFPSYWFYDVLTALDYFQSYGKNKNDLLQAGIELVLKKRNREGTWNLGTKHAGKTYFEMEIAKRPSRWITLRALRVLKWWGDYC